MKKYLIPQNGNFYKANLHSHSTVSDGRNTPKEMKDYYKEHGYQILALTDHELLVEHSDLCEPDFLMLPGYEYAFVENVPYSYARTLEVNLYPKDPKNLTQICFNPKTYGTERSGDAKHCLITAKFTSVRLLLRACKKWSTRR